MSQPLLSLLFVNYQSAALLKRAIVSWEKPLGGLPYEVIVVNNDPNENEAIEKLCAPGKVSVKNLGKNVGFGAANNRAAVLAQGEWLFLLNPDTEYATGSIEELLPVLQAYPHSLGGVCLIDEQDKKEAWSGGRFPTLWKLIWQHLQRTPVRALWTQPMFTETDWVSGAALLISRESFKQLNGFDENFFLYFEDVDLAERAKQKGLSVWRFPNLVVRHRGGASHGEHAKQKQAYYESERRYFSKHRSPLEARCFGWLQRIFFS